MIFFEDSDRIFENENTLPLQGDNLIINHLTLLILYQVTVLILQQLTFVNPHHNGFVDES